MRDVRTQRKRNGIKKHAGGKAGGFYRCIDKEGRKVACLVF